MRDEYIARVCLPVAASAWGDARAFAQQFAEIEHRSTRIGHRESIEVTVLSLLFAQGFDIVARLGEVAELTAADSTDHGFWSLYPGICAALPHLPIEPSAIAAVLPSVLRALENDMTSGLFYSAVEGWAAQSRTHAEGLVDILVQNASPDTASVISSGVAALATFDLDAAHDKATYLTTREDVNLRRAGIISLGRLQYSGIDDPLLLRTNERFAAIRAEPGSGLTSALTHAYAALHAAGFPADNALEDLSRIEEPMTQYAIARALGHTAEHCCTEGWWQRSLNNLVPTSPADRGTFRLIDHAAFTLATKAPSAAVDFVGSVGRRMWGRDRKESDSIHELLPRTMNELHQNAQGVLEAAVSRWFLTDIAELHAVAAEIVRAHSAQGRELALTQEILDGVGEVDVARALQRACGWIVGGKAAAALLVSVLVRSRMSAWLKDVVKLLLSDVVLYNYPGEAGDYLRARVDGLNTQDPEQDVIGQALAISGAYFDALRSLPHFPELEPPSRRIYLRRLADQRMSARIMEEARKKSVMLNLVKRVSLKYGRSFFFVRDGELSAPTELNAFSHEVEFPRGEIIDPIGQLLQRIHLRNAAMIELLQSGTNV